MNRYELIVFDWDGTLMDSIGRIVSSMRHAAQTAGLALPSDDSTKSIIGMSIHDAVEALFPDASVDAQSNVVAGYRHAYLQGDTTPAPLFDGVLSLLSDLKEQGYQLAVATGKARAGLNRVLDEHQLDQFFDVTVTGDEHDSKPHPAMLNHILSRSGMRASKALMVGDSRMDIEMAHAAGVDSVAVGCGALTLGQLSAFSPTYAIEHTCDLFELLRPKGCQA